MRSPLSVAAAVLLVAAVGITGEAGAFTFENEKGDVGPTPAFRDADRRDERTIDPYDPSPLSIGGRGGRSDRFDPSDPLGVDPTWEGRPLPRGARIGAGDHGLDNHPRYRVR